MRTIVLLRISSGTEIFEAKGRIAYVHPGIGEGVAFVSVSPQSLAVLQRWLAQAEKDQKTVI
jgi:hypothetical protein